MRLLVLGGSWFLGRAVVEGALARGWSVTVFRRGKSGDTPAAAELVRGDRGNPEDLARLAESGPWHSVVDTSGYVPRSVLAAARVLEPVVGRYVFVSTVSAYRGWPVEPLTEASPILACPPDAGPETGYDEVPGPTRYGFRKAGAERAVVQSVGWGRAVVLRPGVMLGPREYAGRLTWWLQRVSQGGPFLAPGVPSRGIQPVDVRDVAEFTLDSADRRRVPPGAYNLTAPIDHVTFGEMLAACVGATHADAVPVWVPDEFLLEHDVRQWSELPLWRTHVGAGQVAGDAASKVGFSSRPLADTVRDTWTWMQRERLDVDHEHPRDIGLAPEREAHILREWYAHSGAA